MASKRKANGENTRKKLARACRMLRCTESEFLMSAGAAAGLGRELPKDSSIIAGHVLPYIEAVLARKQKRLPLLTIASPAGRSKAPAASQGTNQVAA